MQTMQIGEVIRKYRKERGMTQEEVAKCLGVTAPAVNKWENGNSLPDIMLLAPIARLFQISLDTLLSFQQELTEEEINNFVMKANDMLKDKDYEAGFQWVKEVLVLYPNSKKLILQMALILDAWQLMRAVPHSRHYEDYIENCYLKALDCEEEGVRIMAADALYAFYVRKEEYEKAEQYLSCFSDQNPEKKRKQAEIYSKTGRTGEAYLAYEELLFSEYQKLCIVFQGLLSLAMEDKNREKAHMLVTKQRELAALFEMGKYHEAVCGLELAIEEKDEKETIRRVQELVENIDAVCGYTQSKLYEHMTFKEISEDFRTQIKQNLYDGFLQDKERFDYLSLPEVLNIIKASLQGNSPIS